MRLRVLFALAWMLALPDLSVADEPEKLSAAALAGKIDSHVSQKWRDQRAVAAPAADDAEWLRRAYLDLTGRIPDILAARDFIEDTERDKRARLIVKLLSEDRYAVH